MNGRIMKRFATLITLLALCAPIAFGQGFAVSGSKLYQVPAPVAQPVPVEVRIRGVNKNHWDVVSYGLKNSGANAIRLVINFNLTGEKNWGYVQTNALDNGMIPIVGHWGGTCNSDPAALSAAVDTWVAQAATWTKLNTIGIVNIANEWGPSDSPVWRDSYITAIARMRAAGYTGLLMIDSGGCGQNAGDVVSYGAAVLASDPLHNLVFDLHVYGTFHYPATASWMQDYTKAFAALKATGLPIIIGEFGPYKQGMSSLTEVPTDKLIADIEANGWGWLAWSYDDGSCTAAPNNGPKGFQMAQTCYGDATHQGDANLTPWGLDIVTRLRALNGKR